jgi:16S rRNA (uracil1498-N3)-methyltransferase
VAHLVVGQTTLLANNHEVLVDDNDFHHLARVLRVKPGDVVSVTDGCGGWVETVVGTRWSSQCLEVAGDLIIVPKPTVVTEIAFALTKADKPEFAVQKLTEIGINRITPFVSERSIARWDEDKAAKHLLRFQAIAHEAVQQSRQVWLPVITPVSTFRALVAERAKRVPLASNFFGRCDRGGPSLDERFETLSTSSKFEVTLAIGPEGGWAQSERQLLPDAVSLTDSVLRAETAAIVAGAFLVRALNRYPVRPIR